MHADRSLPLTARRCRALCVTAALVLAAGCSALPGDPVAAPAYDGAGAARLLAFHRSLAALNTADLARERRQLGAERSAEARMRLALLSLHPRTLNLPRARTLLESVLAAQDADAQAMHDLARLLLDQVSERLRLDTLNDRLAQQVERNGAQFELSARQLDEARARADALQRKLDALAEIERDLSAPPRALLPAGGATPPPADDHRTR